MQIEFKKATIQDSSIILDLMEQFYRLENYEFDNHKTKKVLDELFRNSNLGRLYLFYINEQIIGYIVLTFGFSFEYGGRDAFIDELFILETYRNQGIGQLAMDFIEQKAEEFSVNAIHLEVEKDNDNAKHVYMKKGYIDNKRQLLTKNLI